MIPLWLIGTGKAIAKVFRAVPLEAWLLLAAAIAIYWYGEKRYAAGESDVRKEWAESIARGKRRHDEAVAKRDATAKVVNQSTNWDAQNATVETRTQTAGAVEKVRYVTRTVEVPVGCPVGLPDVVRDEGRAAVERARAAGNSVRAGANPGRSRLAD